MNNKKFIKNLKQSHDEKVAETFTPVAEKIEGRFEKQYFEDEDNQKPTITSFQSFQIETVAQSLRETLTHIGRSKIVFKAVENSVGDVFWIGTHY